MIAAKLLIVVPVGAPSSIGSGAISDKEITVTWTAILPSEMNGQLLGYKVCYQLFIVLLMRKNPLRLDWYSKNWG